VVIVANQASSNSLELANDYRLKRGVPPENVLSISWPGSNIQWTRQEFTNTLLNPLLDFLSQNALNDQIHYVVLSMDIPYRVTGGMSANGTTAALFYGLKSGSGLDNSYAFSEQRFASSPPATAPTNSFLALMLTGSTLQEAKRLVNQGVASDGAFPPQKAWLVKSQDVDRNKRYKAFDNAIFNTRLCDGFTLMQTNTQSMPPWSNLLGCQLGMETFSISSNAFIPGAIADDMTSFGGQIFENPGQTTLLEFTQAGAAGSYGTVTEPQAIVAKFPDPMVYFYQSRGFSLAECYYLSVQQPYQGLFVGEPLAAPWRRTGTGGWGLVQSNSVLASTSNLCCYFTASDGAHPLDEIDLFIDGRFVQTLTNVPPEAGNRLTVQLNGYPVSYDVPANASLASIASGLAAELNQPLNTNVTKVTAQAFGDRIELQSFADPLPEGVLEVVDNGATTNTSYIAVLLTPSTTPTSSIPQLTALGINASNEFLLRITQPTNRPYVLQSSTNFSLWSDLFTNTVGGDLDYADQMPASAPLRLYRTRSGDTNDYASVYVVGQTAIGGNILWVVTTAPGSVVVWSSTNHIDWIPIYTHAGGSDVQISVESSSGAGEPVTTLLAAARPDFLETTARGIHEFGVELDWFGPPSLSDTSYLMLTTTKTNGTIVSLSVTNPPGNTNMMVFVESFADAVNANPQLASKDGLSADDLITGFFGQVLFNLRANATGRLAANIQAHLTGSVDLDVTPASSTLLDQNVSDLLPRNHLYISGGVPSLVRYFNLDTTTLEDGYHELTVVAYEGTHVNSQTAASVPVIVSNTPLQATLSLPGGSATNLVSDSFDIDVSVNTNSVAEIRLLTTGGLYDARTNQSTATFLVNGQDLGVGEHLFHALVTTSNGPSYRTEPVKVILTR